MELRLFQPTGSSGEPVLGLSFSCQRHWIQCWDAGFLCTYSILVNPKHGTGLDGYFFIRDLTLNLKVSNLKKYISSSEDVNKSSLTWCVLPMFCVLVMKKDPIMFMSLFW